jgi:hypothetical protein
LKGQGEVGTELERLGEAGSEEIDWISDDLVIKRFIESGLNSNGTCQR